jgi:hypothetical protein
VSGQGIAIGIDSYSYHRYFGENTAWEKPLETRWSVFDFLRRARDLGVTGVSLQTCYLPPLTDAFAGALRDELRALGLQPVLAWGWPGGTRPVSKAATSRTRSRNSRGFCRWPRP